MYRVKKKSEEGCVSGEDSKNDKCQTNKQTLVTNLLGT